MSSLLADGLTHNLNTLLQEKEAPSVVNLGNINLDGKPKPIVTRPKTRSSKAVVANVEGTKILKKEADTYLKQRTQGKVSNFDFLPPVQRRKLIEEYALPILALSGAKKTFSKEEQEALFSSAWMQKEAMSIKIKDEEVLAVYDMIKQEAVENNTTDKLLPFETIKNRLKSQMIEKTIVGKVMKDVIITIE
jgi:ABC-type proline/glycine betaine transport system ATPase subunit